MDSRGLRKLVYSLERRRNPIGRALFRAALASYRVCDSIFLKRETRPDLVSEKIVLPAARLLFVGVPKVATRSLIAALTEFATINGYTPRLFELDMETLWTRNPEFSGYFKFTFVRNPWSRAASCYLEKLSVPHPIKHARILHKRRGLEAGMTFEAFAEWLNTPEGSDDVADRHWMSQHRILAYHRLTGASYDFIGRFERLAQDYVGLQTLANLSLPALPHKLRTQSRDQYKAMYSDRTIELIGKRYHQDIEYFGYNFDDDQVSDPAPGPIPRNPGDED